MPSRLPAGADRAAESRVLPACLAVYAAASLLHHAHNAEFLDAYPGMPPWLSPAGVYAVWLATTAVGVAGWWWWRRGARVAGLGALALYAALGLYGLAHYLVAPPAAHSLGMNLSIGFEVAAGALSLAVIAFHALRR